MIHFIGHSAPGPKAALRCVITAAAIGLVAAAPILAQPPVAPPLGGPGRGAPIAEEIKLVARFDRDGNKRLDAAERKAAREYLAQQPQRGPGGGRGAFGPGGPGGRGGRGGPGGSTPEGTPGPRLAPAEVRQYGNEPMYDPATLRTFFIDFEDADWEDELTAFYNTDVEVPATVRVDGRTYRDVGVHFRGASSFFTVPSGSKRSLNLSFDFVHENQKLGGYATYNLLNAHTDPSFVRTVLYLDAARSYIPAPKANFVRVVINGESWGVYVSSQQFNRDFARENYGEDGGARWKVPGSPQGRGGLEYLGDALAEYKRLYEIKSKDDAASWAGLVELTRVLNQTPASGLVAALTPILDIDGVLRFLAVDNALVNQDGYWARASDYHIYRDTAGKFHIVPHDANETFRVGGPGVGGRAGRGGPPPVGFPPAGRGIPPGGQPPGGMPIGPGGPGGRGGGVNLDPLAGATDPTRPLLSRLLAVPELRTRYLRYIAEVAEDWLDWGKLGPRVDAYHALIAADVRVDTRKLVTTEAFERSREELKRFADERRAFLLDHPEIRRATGR